MIYFNKLRKIILQNTIYNKNLKFISLFKDFHFDLLLYNHYKVQKNV
jgi:hypothetical protein